MTARGFSGGNLPFLRVSAHRNIRTALLPAARPRRFRRPPPPPAHTFVPAPSFPLPPLQELRPIRAPPASPRLKLTPQAWCEADTPVVEQSEMDSMFWCLLSNEEVQHLRNKNGFHPNKLMILIENTRDDQAKLQVKNAELDKLREFFQKQSDNLQSIKKAEEDCIQKKADIDAHVLQMERNMYEMQHQIKLKGEVLKERDDYIPKLNDADDEQKVVVKAQFAVLKKKEIEAEAADKLVTDAKAKVVSKQVEIDAKAVELDKWEEHLRRIHDHRGKYEIEIEKAKEEIQKLHEAIAAKKKGKKKKK